MRSLEMTLKAKEMFTMVLSHHWIEMEKKMLMMMKAEKFPKYFCSGAGNSQLMESQAGW